MASWTLVPCLVQLRNEFDRIAPNRSKGADGSIGDQAHADRTSDHNPDETGAVPIHDADKVNEVHALDITTTLNESDLTLEKCVQFILARCRRGAGDPLNEERLRYIIFNRRIWRAPAWKQEAYTLSDPHTGHAHFSAEYISSLEADTSSWHLEDIPVALTEGDKVWIKALISGVDEAVLARLRATPENISDTERGLIGDDAAKKVVTQLGPKLDQVLAVVAPAKK